jgi:hypothetical protein
MVALQHVPAHAVLRRLVGVAALLGLFAMHGLGMHGTHHATHVTDRMAQTAQVVQTAQIAQTAPAASAPVHLHHDAGTSRSAGPDDRAPGGALRGLMAMCLAVLLAGVALAILRRRGLVVPRATRSGRRSSPRPGGSRPHRDPPCLFTLSVQRC